jgi:uncharacterized protein (DUF983 family)
MCRGRLSICAPIHGAWVTPDPASSPSPAAADVAIKGLCPRCGARTLFAGMTKFADRCAGCGLDFTQFNVGDGPAAFLTLIVGGLLVGMAVALQLTVEPPLWMLALILIPLAAVAVTGSLRVAKGALLAFEYRNSAREGRIADK